MGDLAKRNTEKPSHILDIVYQTINKHVPEGSKVLLLDAGNGRLFDFLGDDHELHAVENRREIASKMKSRIKKLASVSSIEKYDVIICHTLSRKTVNIIGKYKRLLNPKGRIIFTVDPGIWDQEEIYKMFKGFEEVSISSLQEGIDPYKHQIIIVKLGKKGIRKGGTPRPVGPSII